MLQSYDCRVCNEQYCTDGEKVPRLLICGHSVCHQCLTRLLQEGHRRDAISCPFDRQLSPITNQDVSCLKKNFALIELLEQCTSFAAPSAQHRFSIDPRIVIEQEQLAVPCDEDTTHKAVVYCLRCETSLCLQCANDTHRSFTLSKHTRVPLCDKPRQRPNCPTHYHHLVEFVCLEQACQADSLMCYICKEYGRHHGHTFALFEDQVSTVRQTLRGSIQLVNTLAEESNEVIRQIGICVSKIRGDTQFNVRGTSVDAREKIIAHFDDLRETLRIQEQTALSVIDRHVCERIGSLNQQYDDITNKLTEITAIHALCRQLLQQDDVKLLRSQNDINSTISSLKFQHQQLLEVPEQSCLDPSIPITFTKDNRIHIGPKMEMRVIILGLDDSGKTSILFRLKQDEFIQSTPTIGFNVEPVEYRNLRFTVWDVGGLPKLRPLWKHYFHNTQALIYVVDSGNEARMDEAYDELMKLVQEKDLRDTAILLLANKMDKDGCLSVEELTERLNLYKLCVGRSWHLQGCDALSGNGLGDGLDWLSKQIIASG